jgi:hypothetical protein
MSAGFRSLRDDELRALVDCRSCLRNGLNLGNQRDTGSPYLGAMNGFRRRIERWPLAREPARRSADPGIFATPS